MSSDLFRNLADIAPTYIILGNHDGNLRNISREDAISPIVEALEHPRLTLIRNSEEAVIGEAGGLPVKVNLISIFDKKNWLSQTDPTAENACADGGLDCQARRARALSRYL